MDDEYFMKMALELSLNGKNLTKTNPWVGCIITHNSNIIGMGYHEKFGEAHAEVNALSKCNKNILSECILYTTLESCCHTNKKTGPCVDLIINYGIKEIRIGMLDPDKNVSGKGVEKLLKNGCNVIYGIYLTEIKKSLKPYIYHRLNKMPYVILKISCSLDGKISSGTNTRTDITNSTIKNNTYILREESQAVIVGYNTVMIDNPMLTSRRDNECVQPIRVILNNKGLAIPLTYNIFNTDIAKTLMIIPNTTDIQLIELWKSHNVIVEILPLNNNHFNLTDVKKLLYNYNVLQILIEGGPKLISEVIKFNEWDKIILNYGNNIIGSNGISWSEYIDSSIYECKINDCLNIDGNIQIIIEK